MRAYDVDQADAKFILAQAFAIPLPTTAIAAQSANWLKRGRATLRSASLIRMRAKIPPTHRDRAITWIATVAPQPTKAPTPSGNNLGTTIFVLGLLAATHAPQVFLRVR